MNASPHGKHKVLSTISEVDEEWPSSDILAMAPTDESDQLPDEVALRSRLRRGTTEDLISSLHSLKPSSVSDTRSVEIGILNHDFSKDKLKTSIRNLLIDINRVGQQSDARFLAKNPEAAELLAAGIGSNRRRRGLNQRVRSNSASSSGDVVRDRDVVPELKIRDLRQLNNRFSQHEEPYVLIRRHCVLMSLGPHVRVIVQSKRLMILVRQDEVEALSQTLLNTLSDTIQDLLKNSKVGVELSESQTPFEVKAYCAVFSMYHSLLNKEYTSLLRRSKSMIACISDHTMLSVKLQEFMHTNHDNVVDLQTRVVGTRRMISALLEEDEDELLLLNLTALEHNPSLYGMPFEDAAEELYSSFSDLESIIESILFDFRTIENQADMMVRKLTHVEQSINLKLDTSRNELLFATTILSVFATVIAFSGYVAGAFGMNLDNTHEYENKQGAFNTIFSLTMLLNAFGALLIIALFRYYHILPTHAHLHEGVEEGTYHRTLGRAGAAGAAAEAAVRGAVRVLARQTDARRPSVEATTMNALHFTPV